MLYKCRGCKESKERKEFHYRNFETSIPRKLCWGCEIKEREEKLVKMSEIIIKQKDEQISSLRSQLEIQKKLTNGVQSISFHKSMIDEGKLMKHKNLNVYMLKGKPDEAYFQMKGKYRKYKPVQSKFSPEMCIVVKTGYNNKWYKLNDMFGWIMNEGREVKAPS